MIAPICATDCGKKLAIGRGENDGPASVERAFEGVPAAGYSVSALISALNGQWDGDPGEQDERFLGAVRTARLVLRAEIDGALADERGRAAIDAALRAPLFAGRVVELPSGGLPWQEAVVASAALYVLFPTTEGTWMLQCVPPKVGDFRQKRPLPEAWAGLRDAAFGSAAGIGEDGVFCHPGRFICGARTRNAALVLAESALGVAE